MSGSAKSTFNMHEEAVIVYFRAGHGVTDDEKEEARLHIQGCDDPLCKRVSALEEVPDFSVNWGNLHGSNSAFEMMHRALEVARGEEDASSEELGRRSGDNRPPH